MPVITIASWILLVLLLATTLAATLAAIGRLASWGACGWLAHRLQAEQACATRLHAQAQIETARAKERAQIATAEVQAQAQVAIAHQKAQVLIATAHTRAELARLAHAQQPSPAVLVPPPVTPALLVAPETDVSPDGDSALPELVQWRDVVQRVRPGYFVYGMLANGHLVQKPITTAYHTLYHGETRSGKTTGIHSLVVQAHVLAQHSAVRLYMTDVKRELGAAWGRSPLLAAPVQNDATGAATLIGELVHGPDGVLARYAAFERLAHDQGVICANIRDYERHHPTGVSQRPPLVFVVIDELNALLELGRKADNLQRALTILLQTGAAAGYYVIAGAQYLNAKVFGRDATQQFVSRAHFGTYDPVALRMLFNQTPHQAELGTVPPGRGYIRVQGQAAVLPFQGLYCDEATILDVQRHVRRPAGPAPVSFTTCRAKAASPGERAVEPVATPETEIAHGHALEPVSAGSAQPAIDAGKALQVARLLGGNTGKKAIIAEVWGATTGRRYMAASAEYDRIVSHLNTVGAAQSRA